MRSKFLSWALVAAMAATLTGCGGQPSTPAASNKAGAPPAPIPTGTAKEKAKKSAKLGTAED